MVTIRQLRTKDIPQYLHVLTNLTEVRVNLATARKIYKQEVATNPLHYIFIATDERKSNNVKVIVASCTLLVEPKMIGNGDRVGHIEDVAVAKEYQGIGIGSRIVDHATRFGFEKMNCVRIELDCAESTAPFYEKLGYVYHDILMKKVRVN